MRSKTHIKNNTNIIKQKQNNRHENSSVSSTETLKFISWKVTNSFNYNPHSKCTPLMQNHTQFQILSNQHKMKSSHQNNKHHQTERSPEIHFIKSCQKFQLKSTFECKTTISEPYPIPNSLKSIPNEKPTSRQHKHHKAILKFTS